jgi:hypothetical protein
VETVRPGIARGIQILDELMADVIDDVVVISGCRANAQ